MFPDTNLEACTRYWYRVQAVGTGGTTPGNSASAKTKGTKVLGPPWNSHWGPVAWFYNQPGYGRRALYGDGSSGLCPQLTEEPPGSGNFFDDDCHPFIEIPPRRGAAKLYYDPGSGLLKFSTGAPFLRVMLTGYNFHMEKIGGGFRRRPQWRAVYESSDPTAPPGLPPENNRVFAQTK